LQSIEQLKSIEEEKSIDKRKAMADRRGVSRECRRGVEDNGISSRKRYTGRSISAC
jgi:hypothetical protein